MNIFGSYLKKLRAQAGLSQDKLAEKMEVSKNTIQNWESGKTNIKIKNIAKLSRILNVPESEITAELSRSNDSHENNNWPEFLFDDDNGQVNSVISSLHLNHEQQELFGLLYIYHAEYLEEENYSHSTLENDLKLIPYQFIDKVGSINFLNISDKLQYVLSYVKSDFLIKVLKKDPDKEFDICRLSKDDICDFIDNGLKLFCDMGDWDDDDLLETAIYFNYNMEKAKKILPYLKNDNMLLCNNRRNAPPSDNVPEELLEYCNCRGRAWCRNKDKDVNETFTFKNCPEKYEKDCNTDNITSELSDLTEIIEEKDKDGTTKYYLKITDKGRKLLEWFEKKE